MVIRYTRLATNDGSDQNCLLWAKSVVPVTFLRQQLYLVSLGIASFALLIVAMLFTSNVEYEVIQRVSSELNYSVIVDCGSSGTRAHIFKWKRDPTTSRLEFIRDHSRQDTNDNHITPGLSTFKDYPDKASDYMEPIMEFISNSIPPERHLDTPIYFLATAGMRLLEQSTQKKILSDISRDLRAKFNFPRIKSQVISGEFEGIYSWLSLNAKRLYEQNSNSKSYGMIEMGGASTQVAFELDPKIEDAILQGLHTEAAAAFKRDQITINLSSTHSVKLFATTFLGLGVNTAREAAADLLVRDHIRAHGKLEVNKAVDLNLEDPCLTIGSSETIFRPVDTLVDSQQSIGFSIREHADTFRLTLTGTGNMPECLSLLERVLRVAKSENLNCLKSKHSCSMSLLGTNFIPYSHFPFVGLSEFFFTTNEMMNASGRFNRSSVLEETNRICSTQYSKLIESYSHNKGLYDRILYECFKASWLLAILHDSGFRMPVEYHGFQTVDRLDGEDIDWTTGALIMEHALKKIDPPVN